MLSTTTSNYSNIHVIVYKLKMLKKLAKLKYIPNNFSIVEDGDHVACAISGKKSNLKILHIGMLSYRKHIIHLLRQTQREIKINYFHLSCDQIH